jgi:hypothetical protein
MRGVFRFRNSGREHTFSDTDCRGCEPLNGERYPRPHKDFGATCLGLIHAERLETGADDSKTILVCDTCFDNPPILK